MFDCYRIFRKCYNILMWNATPLFNFTQNGIRDEASMQSFLYDPHYLRPVIDLQL